MARPAKPWYWKQAKTWCVTIDGERIKLGPEKEAAFRKFHGLKSRKISLSDKDLLINVYAEMLKWTQKNRAAGTYRFYKEHFDQFLDYLNSNGKAYLKSHELTVAIFEDYLEELSEGRRAGAVQTIKRVYNWAIKRERITINPILALEKPATGRRP